MNKRKFKYAFLPLIMALWTAFPSFCAAQQVSATSTSRKILIGDQINVWLNYQQSGTKLPTIIWPVIPDSIPGLVWVSKGKIDTLKTSDSVILKQKLVITGFDSGRYFIPSFSFTITKSGDTPQILQTDSLLVQVKTPAVDTTKAFKPIKGIQSVPITWWDYRLAIGLAILGLIIIVIVLLYFLKWRKKKEPAPVKVPPEKAHERALRLLAELKEKKLWQSGETKAYYENLSQIVRAYLENRFLISALERTTDELLKETHKMADLKPYRKQLRRILQTADLAKFARAKPLPEEHENCMAAAEELVQKTKITVEEGVDR